jgi:hypothetical protein
MDALDKLSKLEKSGDLYKENKKAMIDAVAEVNGIVEGHSESMASLQGNELGMALINFFRHVRGVKSGLVEVEAEHDIYVDLIDRAHFFIKYVNTYWRKELEIDGCPKSETFPYLKYVKPEAVKMESGAKKN